MSGWIGIDLDGTLAKYDGFKGIDHIGDPVIPMVNRVKKWLSEGRDVRIFTARIDGCGITLNIGNNNGEQLRNIESVKKPIEMWCLKYIGKTLPITNVKDLGMIELWDDRAIQVVPNTGMRVDGKI